MASDSRGVLFHASDDRNAQFILNRRTSRGVIELHCGWDDIIVVRSGVGELQHGRKLRNLEHYAENEWRAKGIVDGESVGVGTGDVVRIPAGEGHVLSSLGDAPLVYLIVKVRSPEEAACGSLPNRGK